MRREGSGRFTIDWDGGALGKWEGGEVASRTLPLVPLARACFTTRVGLPSPVADRLAECVLDDLRNGEIALVGLSPVVSSDGQVHFMEWVPPVIESAPESDFYAAINTSRTAGQVPESSRESGAIAIEPAFAESLAAEEIGLWQDDPEIAAKLDEAICMAVLGDYYLNRSSAELGAKSSTLTPSYLTTLVEVLCRALGETRPLVVKGLKAWLSRQKRASEGGEEAEAYANALKDLATALQPDRGDPSQAIPAGMTISKNYMQGTIGDLLRTGPGASGKGRQST